MYRLTLLILLLCDVAVGGDSSPEPGSFEFGGGRSTNYVDRVLIPIDDPDSATKGSPADVGSKDFTIEIWLKADKNNDAPAVRCHEYDFVLGNIVIDRDRYNQGQSFGLSLTDGRVTFSTQTKDYLSSTACGTTDLRDGSWHHVAVQRHYRSGELSIFVDGREEARTWGPSGDISYPDDGECAEPSICANTDHYLVIGAEKHDLAFGFSGRISQLRISQKIRYPDEDVSWQPLQADDATVALYSFWSDASDSIRDQSRSGQGPALRRVGQGGGVFEGPRHVSDHPFDR